MQEQRTRPSSVYRIYAEDGTLLYVGVTDRGHTRQVEHVRTQSWAWEIAETQWEHFETRVAALTRERELIRKAHPLHNVVHSVPNSEPSKLEYKLRADQYELLKRSQRLGESLRAELNKQFRRLQERMGAWEKVNKPLLRSLRDEQPLTPDQWAKVRGRLKHLEGLIKRQDASRRESQP